VEGSALESWQGARGKTSLTRVTAAENWGKKKLKRERGRILTRKRSTGEKKVSRKIHEDEERKVT